MRADLRVAPALNPAKQAIKSPAARSTQKRLNRPHLHTSPIKILYLLIIMCFIQSKLPRARVVPGAFDLVFPCKETRAQRNGQSAPDAFLQKCNRDPSKFQPVFRASIPFACELHKYAFFFRSHFIHYALRVYDKNVRFYTCFFCPRTCGNQWIRQVGTRPTPRQQASPAPARSDSQCPARLPGAKHTDRTKDRSAWSRPH